MSCGRRFDREVVYHYPPPGYKRAHPNLPLADPGCKGKVVEMKTPLWQKVVFVLAGLAIAGLLILSLWYEL